MPPDLYRYIISYLVTSGFTDSCSRSLVHLASSHCAVTGKLALDGKLYDVYSESFSEQECRAL